MGVDMLDGRPNERQAIALGNILVSDLDTRATSAQPPYAEEHKIAAAPRAARSPTENVRCAPLS
jgi:hypothetical protein